MNVLSGPRVRNGQNGQSALSDPSGAIAREATVPIAEVVQNERSALSVRIVLNDPRERPNVPQNLLETSRLNGSLVVREPISTQKSRLRAMNVFHQIAAVVTEIVA